MLDRLFGAVELLQEVHDRLPHTFDAFSDSKKDLEKNRALAWMKFVAIGQVLSHFQLDKVLQSSVQQERMAKVSVLDTR